MTGQTALAGASSRTIPSAPAAYASTTVPNVGVTETTSIGPYTPKTYEHPSPPSFWSGTTVTGLLVGFAVWLVLIVAVVYIRTIAGRTHRWLRAPRSEWSGYQEILMSVIAGLLLLAIGALAGHALRG